MWGQAGVAAGAHESDGVDGYDGRWPAAAAAAAPAPAAAAIGEHAEHGPPILRLGSRACPYMSTHTHTQMSIDKHRACVDAR